MRKLLNGHGPRRQTSPMSKVLSKRRQQYQAQRLHHYICPLISPRGLDLTGDAIRTPIHVTLFGQEEPWRSISATWIDDHRLIFIVRS